MTSEKQTNPRGKVSPVDVLRGRGAGQALVLRAVEDARREGFRMLPLCPFARAQFDRNPEWRDVRDA